MGPSAMTSFPAPFSLKILISSLKTTGDVVMPLHEIPGEPPPTAFGFIRTLIPGRKVCQAPTASRASSRRRGPFHFHTTGAEPHFRVGFHPKKLLECRMSVNHTIFLSKPARKNADQTNWAI